MQIWELFRKQFKEAPLWQKVLLLTLTGFLLYYISIRPSIYFLERKLKKLDAQRDKVFRELNSARYILEDAQLISANYLAIQDALDKNLYTRASLQKMLEDICKNNSKKAKIDFPEQPKIYGKIQTLTLQANLTASPDQVNTLLKQLSLIPHAQINLIEYKNQQLLLEVEFLTGSSAPKKTPTTQQAQQNIETIPKISGFLTLGKNRKVIINNRVFDIGDKYGKYTIIDINPTQRTISVRKEDGKIVIWRAPRKGGN